MEQVSKREGERNDGKDRKGFKRGGIEERGWGGVIAAGKKGWVHIPVFWVSEVFTKGNSVPRQGAIICGSGTTLRYDLSHPPTPPFSNCGRQRWVQGSCAITGSAKAAHRSRDRGPRGLDTHSAAVGCCSLWDQAGRRWE